MSLGCRIKKPSWRRLASKGARCTALLGVITLYIAMASVLRMRYDRTPFAEPPLRMAHSLQPLMLSPPVPCIGPGGGDLQRVQFETFSEDEYPTPFIGSQKALGLDETWVTADGRYGLYGFANNTSNSTAQSMVDDWDTIDWGQLQTGCADRNHHRFANTGIGSNLRTNFKRFTLFEDSRLTQRTPSWNAFNQSGRTAIVLRAYSALEYTPEVMFSIRALIAETALHFGSEYQVFLLLHVQNPSLDIFNSEAQYEAAFIAAGIPPELQSITVLWDDNLLTSWYHKVGEHSTLYQVYQPMQLFALHYPEFDHYWQWEMDVRVFGHIGRYLAAVGDFARKEPRKQALERATFVFDEVAYGTYANFTASVNRANNGKSRAWGPVSLPNILPIGPEPSGLVDEDNFTWGVGEDADFITTSFCEDVRASVWGYKNWHWHLGQGEETPRWWCPPAISRFSRTLALAVHEAQQKRGIAVPSEAFISYALHYGLKISYPPQPAYLRPADALREQPSQDAWRALGASHPWLPARPEQSTDGTGHGNPQDVAGFGQTWWWTSDYTRDIWLAWMRGKTDAVMPTMLRVKDGKVYAPNFAIHPLRV